MLFLVISAGCGSGYITAPYIAPPPVISAAASGPTRVDGYIAFGDSITYGFGLPAATQSYPYLIAAQKNMTAVDAAFNGDQACDLFPRQIHPRTAGYFGGRRFLYTIMIGTNDTTYKGKGAYERNYSTCLGAAITFLQLRRTDKLLAGDPGLTLSGGCTATGEGSWFNAAVCPSGGDMAVSSFTTYGKPLYAWYVIDDTARAGALLNITVDGSSMMYSTLQPTPILTRNLYRRSVALARIPVAAGAHSITVHATPGAALLGFGTLGETLDDLPILTLGDIPRARNDVSISSGDFAAYRGDLYAAITLLQSDGLPLRFASTTQGLTGASDEYFDSLHPSVLGQEKLSDSYLSVLSDVLP